VRPISILLNAYLSEHYKIETGSMRKVGVSIWDKILFKIEGCS